LTDYTPVLPGAALTFDAAERLAGGDPVELCGPMLVCHARAGAGTYVGIAGHETPPAGQVTVHVATVVHEGPVAGPAAWGDLLAPGPAPAPDQPPAQVTVAAGGALIIGIALTSAADGQDIRWIGRPLGLPGLPGLPVLPGLPPRPGGPGGGLWFATAGESIPGQSPVVAYGTDLISRPPLASQSVLVIGVTDRAVAAGQLAVVHLAGPLMSAVASIGTGAGFMLVARAPGLVGPADWGPDTDPADRRVIGVALHRADAGQRLYWVARH
jgi:hypothetical protein